MIFHRQFAALPYVVGPAGPLVLLITSRETRRWVLPKGWPKGNRAGWEIAAMEARQEAGVIGVVAAEPLGSYAYSKRLHIFSSVECSVEVYPMAVVEQRLKWRERAQRDLAWVCPSEAALRVEEDGLSEILERFSP